MHFVFKPRCTSFVESENIIWFISSNFNALICMNKINGKIQTIIKIPYNYISIMNSYSFIFKINSDLILIPDRSDIIITYNIDKKFFFSIPIKDHVKISAISNYRLAYLYKEDIIMLPNRTNKIIIYNHLMKKIDTIDIKNNYLNNLYPGREIQFRSQYEIWNNNLVVPFAECGAILILNLVTKEIKIKEVNGLEGCDTINYYKDIFYLGAWNEKKYML